MRLLWLCLLLPLKLCALEPNWSWLSGHWRAESVESISEEQWSSPAGNHLLAFSRVLNKHDQKQVSFEFMHILQVDKQWLLRALPSGRGETDFSLTTWGEQSAEFVNPAHDFPQNIRYWREGLRLCATVSGVYKGQPESETSCWQKTDPVP